jgi:hypothetical protein
MEEIQKELKKVSALVAALTLTQKDHNIPTFKGIEKDITTISESIDSVKKSIENIDTATKKEIQDNLSLFEEKVQSIKDMIPTLKDGETPSDQKLVSLITPLIPKPIKGDKGDTPVAGIDFPLPQDGETPTEEELKAIIEPLIPVAKDGSPDTPAQIVDKLESLEGDDRLDVEAIRGIDVLIDEKIAEIPVQKERVGGGGVVQFTALVDTPSSYVGQAGKVAAVNATETGLEFINTSGGSGDVVGPASATDKAIARFDTTTGKLLQDSQVTVEDNGDLKSVNGIQFDITPTPTTPVEGLMQWNPTEDTMDISAHGVTYQVGQEISPLYKNQTGATITNGTPVMFAGSLGASGRIKIQKAIADGSLPALYTIGITTEDILDATDGHVTWFGKIRGIDTTGTPYGETWVDGDILYISPTTAGYLTKVKPNTPNLQITVAAVINAHATNGTLFVRPTWNNKLVDLDDVNGTPLTTDGQIAVWNQTAGYFDFTENINNKQDTLVSGSNIKTVNGNSLLGSGDITISGGVSEDSFGLVVDGGGSPVTTGSKGYKYIPWDCTITGWNILGDVSGSVVVDVKKSGVSIAGTEKPTLSSASSNQDLALSTWSTSLLAGDVIEFVVDSASTLTRTTLTILVTKV